MTRHLVLAIAVIGTGWLIGPAHAATPLQCEDRAVNCEARCTDITGGAGDARGHLNRCHQSCAQRVNICLSNSFILRNTSVRIYRLRWWD